MTDLRPGLPLAFAEVVERALAIDPAERFTSAGEMERALARALAGTVDEAGRRRRRVLLAAAAALVLGVVLALPLLLHLGGDRAATVRTIAVPPFEAGTGTSEFFGAATAVALRTRLGRLAGLEVVPTVAALRVPAAEQTAAGELGAAAAAVLRGTVVADAKHTRLDLELVAPDDGRPLWRTSASGSAGSLEALEDATGRRLARALGLASPAGDAERADETVDWETRHTLLAGSFYTERRTAAALARAVECFERAVAANPRLAVAHAGLARAWALTATLDGTAVPSSRAWVRSRAAALRALEADPDLPAAHAALGEVAFRHDWDWAIAELELSRALALAPEDPVALEVLAELLSVTGRHEEAIATIDRAVVASPWSAPVRTTAGHIALEAGHFDDALNHLDIALRLDPGYHAAYTVLGSVHEERGLAAEAVEQWQNGLVLSGENAARAEELGRAFATAGMPGVWLWRLQRLEQARAEGHASAALLARAHAALGHTQEALAWLERAAEQHDDRFLRTKEEPAFDSIRAAPEFVALRGRLSLDAGMVASLQPTGGHALTLDAALYRDRGGRAEALASGAATRPGDRLFLAVTCQEAIHLYVLNEDRRGNLFVLFPVPELEPVNPLPARRRHRIPGERDGVTQDWVVTSAGGRETILVVAAREPLHEVELEIGQLRVADAGRPVADLFPGGAPGRRVRGVGGLAAEAIEGGDAGASRLTRLVASLAERAARGEVWLRQYVLENPGG